MSNQAPRIHVLEVVGNAIVGGMETYVARLVERLPRAQFAITCVCPFESPFTERLRSRGCAVYITPIFDDPSWLSIQFTTGLIRRLGVQVIHAHLWNAHLLASICASLTGVPLVATMHGRTVPVADFEIYRVAESILTLVCQNAYQHALSLGVHPGHAVLIPNGVPVELFAGDRKPGYLQSVLHLPAATRLVGFIGRLEPEKGPLTFVQMAALLRTAVPDVHFVLVGDGSLRNELLASARALGIEDKVHFTGARFDMPAVLASLELTVLTSESEGMPLALMEAMASGIASVASSVGGVPEIVLNGVTGLLVPPRSPDAAANAVAMLLGDPARVLAMGTAARERAQSHFGIDGCIEAVGSVLQAVALRGVPRITSSGVPHTPQTEPTRERLGLFPSPAGGRGLGRDGDRPTGAVALRRQTDPKERR